MKNSVVKKITAPFVTHGIFNSDEEVLHHLARDYVLRQVGRYRKRIKQLKATYRVSLDEFEEQVHALCAEGKQIPALAELELHQQVMQAEDDLEEWQAAEHLLSRWLSIQAELDNA
jgi:hypothetical protein